MASRNNAGLSRERIIVEALHIIAGRGLGGLSMRRLGDALEVEAMAVYHHFPRGKEQLFNSIAAYVTTARVVSGLSEGEGPEEEELPAAGTGDEDAERVESLPWDRRITVWAEDYRARLLAYSGAMSLLMHRAPRTLAEHRTIAMLDAALAEAGLSGDDVPRGRDALLAYCLGSVGHQVRHEGREDAPEEAEALARFLFGLRALLRGLTP
ncbi:TetR/AcrR family transcriptional regulator [Nocardiopsis sp. MG754419]|uniref:TetR/AcrR family transcriptional regulator n=1 Tax=Nocardiopsis sp. MG754419 TaxID=2259865 RepID=UPI001BA6295F|nr:TetR/AcrR family transcriptional regulator [Nocardiopsis sp. MG754419]MBR8745408.1 TetR/AcrR family transcriptional regulator [Nocardiopsis sp. MG754419]